MIHVVSRLRLSVLLVVVSLAAASALSADRNYSFLHVTSEDGLSASNVKSIVRDPFGFVWFGTKNGLNRYDGHDIKRYNCQDTDKKRGNNNVGALYNAADSIMWVGTDRGIFRFDPMKEKFTYVDGKAQDGTEPYNWVQRITGDNYGNIWALLPDMGIFRIKENRIWYYPLKSGSEQFKEIFYSDVCVDDKGVVWAATSGDGIYRYDRKRDSFIRAVKSEDSAKNSFCRLIDGGDGALLAAASDGRVFRVLPSADSGVMKEIPISEAGNIYVRDISKFDTELWIAAQGGLLIKDLVSGEEGFLHESPVNEFSISDNTIYCIYRDNENSAWLGTMYGGADYMSRRPFRFYKYGLDSGITGRRVRGMAMNSDGTIMVGTEDAGVNVFNVSDGRYEAVPGSPTKTNTVVSLATVGGSIFAGFQAAGLYRMSGKGGYEPIFHNDSYSDNSIYSYLMDSWGTEWIGSGFSLYRKNQGETEFKRVGETGYDWIFAMKETSDGMLWIGTMGNGLYRYDRRAGKFKKYVHSDEDPKSGEIGSNSINDIMEDSSGTVWISTDRGGLNRYNKKTDDFTVFGPDAGLPDDVVYSVLEDPRHNLWFGTNLGLCKLNPANGQIKVFTMADGLPSNQFSYQSAIAHPSGRFYFGTVNGMVAFDPNFDDTSAMD
ncbi:MAG: hybrid sensor histidine kinase/response regulator, partial [Muribaculaceae bacterium]|nr:hybrid sensor histidine kinase/response regulator [Muribaculaceae bacterium]